MPVKTTTTPEKYLMTKNNDNNTDTNGTVTPIYPRTSIDNIVKSTTDNTTLQSVLDGKQSTITVNPSTTTATLTGLGIDGTNYAVGGGGSSPIIEYSTDNKFIIWNHDPGLYLFTYPNGTSGYNTYKYVCWRGTNTSSTYSIQIDKKGPVLISIIQLGAQKSWYFIADNKVYAGYSSISGGAHVCTYSLGGTLHTMTFMDDNNNAGSFTVTVKIPKTTAYKSTAWSSAHEAIMNAYYNVEIPCSGVITYGLPQMQPGTPVILASARFYQDSNYKKFVEFRGCDMDNGSCGLYTCAIQDDWIPILIDIVL